MRTCSKILSKYIKEVHCVTNISLYLTISSTVNDMKCKEFLKNISSKEKLQFFLTYIRRYL